MAYWLNVKLLSNMEMISLWFVGIVPGLSDFYSQGCLRDSLSFLSCGADRNRYSSLNHMGVKILVSQSFTFCHFRINVIVVPIYLPNLEKSKGILSMGKPFVLAFPVPLWLLPWTRLLFHLCFLKTPLLSYSIVPRHLLLPPVCREVGDCFTCNREEPIVQQNSVTISLRKVSLLLHCCPVMVCLLGVLRGGTCLRELCAVQLQDHTCAFESFPSQTLPGACALGMLAVFEGCANLFRALESSPTIASLISAAS